MTNFRKAIELEEKRVDIINLKRDFINSFKGILLQLPKEKREEGAKNLMVGFSSSCGRYEEEMCNMDDFSWIHNVVK